ncbi:MAG: protein kinase, partial [Myxococcales bacterium]|nr:protein kinase [Myxococcales bacterium]
IVHRDVSPQNILVGADGLARLLDFGIAKGKGRLQTTRAGQLKGKVSYMAPEQILGEEPDPRSDVYAAAVVLWEALTGQRLFPAGDRQADAYTVIPKILEADIEPPSSVAPDVPRVLDGIVMRGLNRERDARWESARAFAVALEESVGVATPRRIGEWVHELAEATLAKREGALRALEASHPDSQDLAGELLDATIRRRRKRHTSPGDTPVSGPGGVVADAESTPVDREATPAAGIHGPRVPEEVVEAPPNTRRDVPEAAVSSPVLSPRPPRDEELELRLVQHNEAQARAFEEARRAAEDRVNARRAADDQAREERSKAATVPDVSSVMRDAGIAADPFASAPSSPVSAPIPSAPIPSAAPPTGDDDALELPLAKSPLPLPAIIAIGVVVLIVVLWLALR